MVRLEVTVGCPEMRDMGNWESLQLYCRKARDSHKKIEHHVSCLLLPQHPPTILTVLL